MLARTFGFMMLCGPAFAAGPAPAVNVDMGCTLAGHVMAWNGTAIVCIPPTRPAGTVSGIPACAAGTQGQMFIVTDALTPVALAVVVAGGSAKTGVLCNGTNWIVQ